jgi:hypothetical protein
MIIFLLLFTLSFGKPLATTDTPKARILSAIDNQGGDLLNMLYNIGSEIQGAFDPAADTFAIRVCSNEPLRIALPLAAGDPFLTTTKLEKLGVPKSRIYYLRQNRNCAIPKNGYALTEYWWIPKGAEFPEHLEARSAANLVGHQFTNWGQVEKGDGDRHEVDDQIETLTPKSYAAILEKVVAQLKEHKNAITVIEVRSYARASSNDLKKRLTETQSYFSRNGISPYRIHTKQLYWGPKSRDLKSDQYPNIFVVIEN